VRSRRPFPGFQRPHQRRPRKQKGKARRRPATHTTTSGWGPETTQWLISISTRPTSTAPASHCGILTSSSRFWLARIPKGLRRPDRDGARTASASSAFAKDSKERLRASVTNAQMRLRSAGEYGNYVRKGERTRHQAERWKAFGRQQCKG
jgi:hypothetical protein